MQRIQNNWDDIARARVRLNRGPRFDFETKACFIAIAITLLVLSFLGG